MLAVEGVVKMKKKKGADKHRKKWFGRYALCALRYCYGGHYESD
jgi:hypothetical protein